MSQNLILWIYIILLIAGGLVGFLKAGSKVSLIMSVIFGAILSLMAAGILVVPHLTDIVLALLLVVFGMRLAKTKKFVPGGLMLVLTTVVLGLRHIRF